MRRYLNQRLRLQALRVIDALDTHGSLLRASVALGVSQPAVSRTLKETEALVEAELFQRHARGVVTTEAGKIMLRSGRRILKELERAEEELDALAAFVGETVFVGVLPVASPGLMPALLTALQEKCPNVQVRLREGRTEELLPLLALGHLDLVIGRFYPPETPDTFVRRRLWSDPIAIIARAGHPVLTRPGLNVEDLVDYQMVLIGAPKRLAGELDDLLDNVNPSRRGIYHSTSHGFIREMLIASDAITLLPPIMWLGEFERGEVGARTLSIPVRERPAGVILAPGRTLSVPAQNFLDFVGERIGALCALCAAHTAAA